ncbi:hypothetical protein FA95DRAFT_1612190 [Auriscalpium vulgare]|uniref:Uncharacterized protein n=1 Tax=Auriscalpium vulgare TaxID=40419 RepID=A0ACB8R712_9AGAM|nr:hypothetical protein FA95DRAFT_1612190 [Auriscalpium vulgare]
MTPPPLPFDVHARTIQFVYIASQNCEIDYKTLSACALVCKDWVPLAQRLLFRRIPYPDNEWLLHAIHLLLRTVTTSPHLGTYVLSIPIEIKTFWPENKDANDTYLTLLRCCPHIAQVRLEVPAFDCTEALQELGSLGLRPTVLVVDEKMLGVMSAVLEMWPSVRHLVVETPKIRGIAFPLPAQLHSVAYTGGTFLRYVGFRKLVGLNHFLADELEVGSMGLRVDGTFTERIEASLRGIMCLTIPSNAELQHMTHLQSLILPELPSTPIKLPRTLRHFGYHVNHNKETETTRVAQRLGYFVSALADESALPELREVSVTRSSSQEVVQAFERLHEARRVDVFVYADPESYPVRYL